MTNYTLVVGLFDKDTHAQEIDTVKATLLVNKIVTAFIGFGTISQATGVYTHENGEMVIEPSIRIEVLATEKYINDDLMKEVAQALKSELNQESVLFQKTETKADFI